MVNNDQLEFNPDIELDRGDQAALAAIVSQPGFKVFQKIGKACVDQFIVDLINKTKDEDVLLYHRYAKSAALFYTRLISRINFEVELYINTIPSEKPIEAGVGVDIGEYANPETFGEEEPLTYE